MLANDGDVTPEFFTVHYEWLTPNNFFSIDENTGIIKLNEELDYETKTLYNLKVIAYNKDASGNKTMKNQVDVSICLLTVRA